MTGNLTLLAAFLLGLAASGHCVLMCGGISGALLIGGGGRGVKRPPLRILVAMQAGRIFSYALAAVALAGTAAALVRFVDQAQVRLVLRLIAATTFAIVGLAMFGAVRGIDSRAGQAVWRRLAPLARGLLPMRRAWQAFALGAVWGWMPCGFVYSVLLIAWLSMDPLRAAATMVLFGLGTVPALLAANLGLAATLRMTGRQHLRTAMAAAMLLMAALTLGGPWLAAHGGHFAGWLPADCITP